MRRPALFLDRDGVINRNRGDYVKSWGEFEFLPGSLNALRQLSKMDVPIVVVTNQSAIGRGLLTIETLMEINANMANYVRLAGGRITKVLYCPHLPDAGCACRKPRPGMLLQAACELDIDLTCSLVVGDTLTDIAAAHAAGCAAILVKSGLGSEELEKTTWRQDAPRTIVEDLAAAVVPAMVHFQRVQDGSLIATGRA